MFKGTSQILGGNRKEKENNIGQNLNNQLFCVKTSIRRTQS
jgi:hypothetical protein